MTALGIVFLLSVGWWAALALSFAGLLPAQLGWFMLSVTLLEIAFLLIVSDGEGIA